MVLNMFSFSITWEFVRNMSSLAQGRTYKLETLELWSRNLENHEFGFSWIPIVSALEALFPSPPNSSKTKPPTTWAMAFSWPGVEVRHEETKGCFLTLLFFLIPILQLPTLTSTNASKLSSSDYSVPACWCLKK